MLYSQQNVTASRPGTADSLEGTRAKVLGWNQYDAELVVAGRAHLAQRIADYAGDFAKDLALFRKLSAQF